MPDINLLPWRHLHRVRQQQRKIIFSIILLILVIVMVVVYWSTTVKKSNPIVFVATPIEGELTKLRFVGYVHQGNRTWALVIFPDGEIKNIQVGTRVDFLRAQVIDINEQQVTLIFANHQQHFIKMTQ